MNGSTYKRCRCRDATGRELGAECPSLHRKDGTWNPRHGQWYFRLDLPTVHGAPRKVMKRGGHATQPEAEETGKGIDQLLVTPERGRGGDQARRDLLTAIENALTNRTALPDYDEMRRRYAA